MTAETIQNSVFTDSFVSVALFENVTNCKELKQLAIDGKIKAALLKPCLVIDRFQVFAAATKALHLHRCDKKVTRSLYSELIYSISPSKNISDAFKKFGIDGKDCSVLIVEVHSEGDSTMGDITDRVKGTAVSLATLHSLADESLIRKIYKVDELELTTGTLLDAVVGRIASKQCMSF